MVREGTGKEKLSLGKKNQGRWAKEEKVVSSVHKSGRRKSEGDILVQNEKN